MARPHPTSLAVLFVVLLACTVATAAEIAGAPEAAARVEAMEDIPNDLDDEEEEADDGSRLLPAKPDGFSVEALRPLDLEEEKALLGNWGDAAEESED